MLRLGMKCLQKFWDSIYNNIQKKEELFSKGIPPQKRTKTTTSPYLTSVTQIGHVLILRPITAKEGRTLCSLNSQSWYQQQDR